MLKVCKKSQDDKYLVIEGVYWQDWNNAKVARITHQLRKRHSYARIEISVSPLKPVTTGLTGYRKNRSKIQILNLRTTKTGNCSV
jgi:hypothetical protein